MKFRESPSSIPERKPDLSETEPLHSTEEVMEIKQDYLEVSIDELDFIVKMLQKKMNELPIGSEDTKQARDFLQFAKAVRLWRTTHEGGIRPGIEDIQQLVEKTQQVLEDQLSVNSPNRTIDLRKHPDGDVNTAATYKNLDQQVGQSVPRKKILPKKEQESSKYIKKEITRSSQQKSSVSGNSLESLEPESIKFDEVFEERQHLYSIVTAKIKSDFPQFVQDVEKLEAFWSQSPDIDTARTNSYEVLGLVKWVLENNPQLKERVIYKQLWEQLIDNIYSLEI